MRVLVTGHNGFIGSVLAPFLHDHGHEVVGLDTYYYEDCTFGKDRSPLPAIRKDVRDVTEADVRGFDAVVHLAALCNDPLGDLNPALTHEINHAASVRLADAAKRAGVARFLYASSCSMYGASGHSDLLTEEAPLRPLTAYAVSKVRAEEDIARLASPDFSPVFMRNATAYGASPRLRADVMLNNLVCWAHTTGKVRIMSDGTPWRPIIHVEDIARAFLAVLEAPRDAVHNEALNVGVERENYQVRDVARIVEETVPGCVVEYAGGGGPDPRDYRVDFSKIRERVPGFRPAWDARRGAREVAEACREVGLTLEEFQGRRYLRLNQLKELIGSKRLDGDLRWSKGGTP